MRQLILFGVAGVVGYVVDATITTLLESYLGVYFARVPSFLAAATTTWLINRTFTFGAHSSHHTSIIKEYFHYLSLMVVGLAVNYAAYAISITVLQGGRYAVLICVAIGSLAGLLVNFVVSKRYIFNKPSDQQRIN